MKSIKSFLIILLFASVWLACGESNSNTADKETNATSSAATKASVGTAEGDAWMVDPSGSEVAWLAKKVTGQHNGTVNPQSGILYFQEGNLTGGEVTIDMNSIEVLDIEDPEMNQDLTNHLRSEDFFAVEAHPTATLAVTSVEATPQNDMHTHMVTGDLTIKGISKPVTFPAVVRVVGEEMTIEGQLTVDRTDYDIKYRSGKFFPEIGDKMIYDPFDLTVSLKAKPAGEEIQG